MYLFQLQEGKIHNKNIFPGFDTRTKEGTT